MEPHTYVNFYKSALWAAISHSKINGKPDRKHDFKWQVQR